DGGCPHALRTHFSHLRRIDRGLPTSVDTARFRVRNTLKLTLLAQVGFELREYAEHVEEAFPRCRAGVDWLFSGSQGRSSRLHDTHDVLQVSDAAREAVNARDHQNISSAKEVENCTKLIASGDRSSTALFRSD